MSKLKMFLTDLVLRGQSVFVLPILMPKKEKFLKNFTHLFLITD